MKRFINWVAPYFIIGWIVLGLLSMSFARADTTVDEYLTAQEKDGVIIAVAEVAPLTMEDYMLKPAVRIRKEGGGSGSGIAFRTDEFSGTRILTNYHVIAGKPGGIHVQFYGETDTDMAYIAYVVSYDKAMDIAVLILEESFEHVAVLGNMSDVQVLDETYCVGSPLGLPPMVTKGIISNVDLFNPNIGNHYFQSDCKIFSGNSGGGMFVQRDDQWVLVGINTWVLSGAVSGGFTPQQFPIAHLGFAVRIDDIRGHLQEYGMNPE